MPGSPPPPRPDRRKLNTHRALIAAVRRLLHDRRVNELTISEITEAADVGVGTFYNHFPSIDRLVEVAAEEAFAQLEQQVRNCRRIDDRPPVIVAIGILVALRDVEPNLIWSGFRRGAESHPALIDETLALLRSGNHGQGFSLDADLGIYLVAGALNGTILAERSGNLCPGDHADVAQALLRLLGCDPGEAADHVRVAALRLTDAPAISDDAGGTFSR